MVGIGLSFPCRLEEALEKLEEGGGRARHARCFPCTRGFCQQQSLGGEGGCPVLFLAEGEVLHLLLDLHFSHRTPGTRLVQDALSAFRKNMETLPFGILAPEVQPELKEV